MYIKDIIFRISALIILGGGAFLFDYFQEKIDDSTWIIVISKIAIAIALLVVYGLILTWVAGLCHIEWQDDF